VVVLAGKPKQDENHNQKHEKLERVEYHSAMLVKAKLPPKGKKEQGLCSLILQKGMHKKSDKPC
jgi:hypothetical protein